MAEQTGISWADATFNPWIGCTKVSTGPQGGCEHCYAERENDRRHWVGGWGHGVPRHLTKTWGNPVKWNREAAISGARPRVFCASLADVFDNEVPEFWRLGLWQLVRKTPNLRWMFATHRIGNAAKMVPADWPFAHAGVIMSVSTQDEFDRDWLKLAALPAPWRGVSAEPLLGLIRLHGARPDWVITGGESGPGFRATDPDWVRAMRDDCASVGIAFHHKQWQGLRSGATGCLVDGIDHKGFPEYLQ